jgi:hypothetical protein
MVSIEFTGSKPRSFAKDIAELALYLELTKRNATLGYLETAILELALDRLIPAASLKRCASEARALIDYAHESGSLESITARASRMRISLRDALDAWIDEISLAAVLKLRARRLQGRYGGRPSSRTRILNAVQDLVVSARDGREDALAELQSIRALIERLDDDGGEECGDLEPQLRGVSASAA